MSVGQEQGETVVRKRRRFHAPFLVRAGDLLNTVLDTGVHVLPHHAWAARERRINHLLRGSTIRVHRDGAILLPCLPGESLARVLERPGLDTPTRNRAIELAVMALAELHRHGVSHGDAMADNVLIDLESGCAHWIDFETVHDPDHSTTWCRADDLRALLATCHLRTPSDEVAGTLERILECYGDDDLASRLAGAFDPASQRRLVLHLGQAALSFRRFHEVAHLLRARTRSHPGAA